MLDWNLLGAVRNANLWSVETWVEFGPVVMDGGPLHGQRASRICPECAALVVNEDNLLQMHSRTHMPKVVTPTRFAGVPYSEQPGSHYVPNGPTSGGEAA